MPRSSPVRKFGPLASLAGVQLMLVLVVPSTARPSATDAALAGPTGLGTGVVDAAAGGATGGGAQVGTGPTGTSLGGASGSGGGTGAGASGPTAPGAVVAGPGAVPGVTTPAARAALADTRHCVGGRQYDPGLEYFAPPCLGGVPGAAYPGDNGGKTWQGVTKDTVEIVTYIPDYGAEVNTILKVQGLYYDAGQAATFAKAYGDFINSHYQLYGRKVHMDTYQGTCSTVPPDYQCLNGEMDRMVATYHPYAVVFSTTLCSACYAELARLKVVSTGGAGFSDAFRNGNAPYVYDQGMSSTRIEQQFADFWCHQMTSKGGSGRTAVFAGGENPAQDFRGKPRELGVVATNDPDIQQTVRDVLLPALDRGCGEKVTHTYFYANDISTATQQSNAGTAAMNTAQNPATSVLCLCDPVAPQFSYNAAATQNYWPEALIASNQAMDTDASAQTYVDNGGQTTLACPKAPNCSFDGALGIGEAPQDVAEAQLSAVRVFRSASKGPLPVAGLTLQIFWDNYNMLASLISNTGPLLTPARMQALAPSMGLRGGGTTGHQLRGFVKGQWTWTRDVRVVYFAKHRTSPYNGKPGAWVAVEGGRKDFGQFATLPQPPAPPADKRG